MRNQVHQRLLCSGLVALFSILTDDPPMHQALRGLILLPLTLHRLRLSCLHPLLTHLLAPPGQPSIEHSHAAWVSKGGKGVGAAWGGKGPGRVVEDDGVSGSDAASG